MKRFATAAILAAAVALPAMAQQAAPLTYIQPLSPDAVRSIQQRLAQTGDYRGQADGVWGADSTAALQHFQQVRGLQVTGQMNQATAATLGLNPVDLLQLPPGGQAAPPQGPKQLGPEDIRNVQAQLKRFGFYAGPVDGNWGPGTQGALTQFQQGRGLEATGRLTPQTATALGLDPYSLQPR